MWVIFEGLDKAGKTTLEWSFLKATNFKINVIDRGPIGYLVFDKIFGRTTKDGDQEFIRQAKKINKSKDFFVVYCIVDSDIAKVRLEEHKEKCPYDYDEAQKLMKKKMSQFYSKERMLILDTTNKSIEQCTDEIIDWMEEVNKNEKCNLRISKQH